MESVGTRSKIQNLNQISSNSNDTQTYTHLQVDIWTFNELNKMVKEVTYGVYSCIFYAYKRYILCLFVQAVLISVYV